eukprot:1572018-Amphidinium_carterae.1
MRSSKRAHKVSTALIGCKAAVPRGTGGGDIDEAASSLGLVFCESGAFLRVDAVSAELRAERAAASPRRSQ